MGMLISQVGGIFPQGRCISNHCEVHFNYLIVLFVNHTSVKLKKIARILKFLGWPHASNLRDVAQHLVGTEGLFRTEDRDLAPGSNPYQLPNLGQITDSLQQIM